MAIVNELLDVNLVTNMSPIILFVTLSPNHQHGSNVTYPLARVSLSQISFGYRIMSGRPQTGKNVTVSQGEESELSRVTKLSQMVSYKVSIMIHSL